MWPFHTREILLAPTQRCIVDNSHYNLIHLHIPHTCPNGHQRVAACANSRNIPNEDF